MKKIIIFMLIMIVLVNGVQGALTDSLIAYYDMDNSSGIDDSQLTYNGINSGATYSTGKINGSYDFEKGDGDWINLTDINAIDGTTQMTISLWVNEESQTADDDTIISKWLYNTQGGWSFQNSNGVSVDELTLFVANALGDTGTNSMTTDNANIPVGVWTHIVFVYNGSQPTNATRLKVYKNNTLINYTTYSGNIATSMQSNTASITLGRWTGTLTRYFDGKIDEVGIWNRTLTSTEVSQLWNSGSGLAYSSFATSSVTNFSVTAINSWNSSAINTFNLTMQSGATTYNFGTINGSITTNVLTNSTSLWNLTYWDANSKYFNNSYQNINVSSNHQGSMNQSIINITVRELFTNATISNFSINLTGFGIVINTSGSYGVIYPLNGSYNASVIDNGGAESYHTTSSNFNVSPLDNKTVTLYVHQHHINVYALDIQTNATISNFTINLTDLNVSDNRQNVTTSNVSIFEVIHHSYNLTIVSAMGYAVSSSDGTFNQTQTVSVSADTNVTFYLYKYNSVNFSFYDVDAPTILLTTVNISLGLFFMNDSVNYTTSVGWIFAENLTAGDWEARYDASGYNPNNYFFTVSDSSTQRISLYLQNDSSTTLFKIILRDQNDDVVSNNTIRLQEQFVDLGGQYVTIRECVTNEVGVCYMYIQEGIDTSYRFIVIDIDGGVIKTTESAPIITLASEDKIITIRVDTGSNLVDPLERVLGIDADITFSGNVSTYDFIDGYNAITSGCFKVSRRDFDNSSYVVLNYSCVDGTSGSLSYNFSLSLQNDSVLLFQGFVNYTDSQHLVAEQSKSNKVAGVSYDEDDNLFFILILFCFVSFAMIFVPNIFIQILVDFGVLIGVVWIGYSVIGIAIIMSFLALGLFIAWDRKTARGFN